MINYDNYGCYYCCNNANALNTILIYYIAGLGSLVLLVCILFLPFSSSLFLFSIRNTTTGRYANYNDDDDDDVNQSYSTYKRKRSEDNFYSTRRSGRRGGRYKYYY